MDSKRVPPAPDSPVVVGRPDADAPTPPTWVQRVGWARIAAAAVAALFALSLTFAPVRGLASDFLKVFRTDKIESLSLSAEDLTQITSSLESAEGRIDLASLGEVDVEGAPSMEEVSFDEAQAATDFEIALPEGLDEEPTIVLQAAQTYRFSLNVEGVNELLAAFGSQRELPAELDGREFTFEMPAIVTAEYSRGDSPVSLEEPRDPDIPVEVDFVMVTQGRSPELVVPAGVDAKELRDVLVSLPILPDNVRGQLEAVDDWQHTLIVPVQEGTSREVLVDGTSVLLVEPDSGASPSGDDLPFSAAIWNDGGVIRSIEGTVDQEMMLDMVESMIR
ncbi:MAG: hypothetical protein OEV43_05480 [Coriobacteriia bacterium]|nr:hypothetical protein [Coriobacteriia bacterium]